MKAKDLTILHPNRVYLDNCSSYNSMFNEELLYSVCKVQAFLYGHCNYGVSKTNWVGNYVNLESWIYRYGINNILSVPVLKILGYRTTYNSYDG